jgi:hypothetical protein
MSKSNNIELSIDEEWADFVSSGYNNSCSSDEEKEKEDEEFDDFTKEEFISADISKEIQSEIPKASNIYISTKTKIAYLNKEINLKKMFWDIPIIPYATPSNGVVKKQMKFNSTTMDELIVIQEKLTHETYFEEHIITSINNPTGRITFKDIRKVSIGISKKDLTSYRCKKKSAFYNCFVLIFRLKVDELFKEFHVKVFNTGKVEIPGVQNDIVFDQVLELLLKTLQTYMEDDLNYKENCTETVLINSNFKCGFFINREALYDILKYKYNIQAIFDPCSYPGIQCKFKYNHDTKIQTGSQISEENKKTYTNVSEVSFMIFRTGSVLIVGKCDENVLIEIYEFLKNILITEYNIIKQKCDNDDTPVVFKDKKKKIKKKIITVTIT